MKDQTNVGSDYTAEEFEFLQAMERYRREKRRPFPTFTEVLAVARSLGYRKVAPSGESQRSAPLSYH